MNTQTAIGAVAVRRPKETELDKPEDLDALIALRTALSPNGVAVAMKLFHAAIVAVGAIYVDCVVPSPQ